MTTELAASLLAIAEAHRDQARALPDHIRHELEQIAGNTDLSAMMRAEAGRLIALDGAR